MNIDPNLKYLNKFEIQKINSTLVEESIQYFSINQNFVSDILKVKTLIKSPSYRFILGVENDNNCFLVLLYDNHNKQKIPISNQHIINHLQIIK
jgi:hypothetical protein